MNFFWLWLTNLSPNNLIDLSSLLILYLSLGKALITDSGNISFVLIIYSKDSSHEDNISPKLRQSSNINKINLLIFFCNICIKGSKIF